jgi:hypothetical protein
MSIDTIIREPLLRCHACDTPVNSVSYEVFPDPTRDELKNIQLVHAEAALETYRRLEGDKGDISADRISNAIAAMLHVSDNKEFDTFSVMREALDRFAHDKSVIL